MSLSLSLCWRSSSLICFTRNHIPLLDLVGDIAQDAAYFSTIIKQRHHLHPCKLTQLPIQGQAEEKSHSHRRWDPIGSTGFLVRVTYWHQWPSDPHLLNSVFLPFWEGPFLSTNSKCSSNSPMQEKNPSTDILWALGAMHYIGSIKVEHVWKPRMQTRRRIHAYLTSVCLKLWLQSPVSDWS